jgi:hypothetical protein
MAGKPVPFYPSARSINKNQASAHRAATRSTTPAKKTIN